MSKIAIISQPEKGVLLDVGGCSTLQEALEQLSSTLQSSNQFWKGSTVLLAMGKLDLTAAQAAQILAIAKGVGVFPEAVVAKLANTRAAFAQNNVKVLDKAPMSLPKIKVEIKGDIPFAETEPDDQDLDETKAKTNLDVSILELEHDTIEYAPLPEPKAEQAAHEQKIVLPQVLYLKQHLRSGQTVSHKGDLVIIGDVNPGAEIMAEGDITVWGSLRGIAHAGIGGNTTAEIRALNLQPLQIRIAHAIARAPDRPRFMFAQGTGPEIARMVEGKIRVQKNRVEPARV